MKVTVSELSNTASNFERDWQGLVDHVNLVFSDLVLLPEMPFHPWIAQTNQIDPEVWKTSVEAHDRWMPRLAELHSTTVVGTRPVMRNDKRINEGFIWEISSGYQPAHDKYYLPNEDGFWEASWYERGNKNFTVIQTSKASVGFLICTELWFNVHAREYAKQGIHLLVCPRATPMGSVDKWIAGGRTAAVVSGALCLSSNFSGGDSRGIEFGGNGWIIEPEEGDVLGLTSRKKPFLTLEIDLKAAENAKRTYPRYVLD